MAFRGARGTDASFSNFNENRSGSNQINNITYNINCDDHPPSPTSSRFDSRDIEPCLEGTRKEILRDVDLWITAYSRKVRQDLRRIYWISGIAGTGKTTIAYTVARKCKNLGILGASFFCSRDNIYSSDPRLIFTTIADQLGKFHSSFRDRIAEVYKKDPGVNCTSILNQLEELLVKPLSDPCGNFPRCVVVLDALDECKDPNIILSSLSQHIDALSPLIFLITSRPEPNITRSFRLPKLQPTTQWLDLHESELDVAQQDIELYLKTSLGRVREQYKLSGIWPMAQHVQTLTHLSSGSFIFAATAVKFIEDLSYSNPMNQLDRPLQNTTILEDSSPQKYLDQLYIQVLTNSPNISPDLSDRLKKILGTIAIAQYPLSMADIGEFLELDVDNNMRLAISYLGSVLIVPRAANERIRFIHPSFLDYITKRCSHPHFMVDPRMLHVCLAQACLRVMKRLKRDICEIKDPSKLHSEVPDLQERIKTYVPPHFKYACRSWHYHFSESRCQLSDVLLKSLEEFCSESLLRWVEVCSLLGDLRNALLGLDAVCRLISGRTNTAPELLRDCMQFIRDFFPAISIASSHVYKSALPFTPTESLLRRTYEHELKGSIKVNCGVPKKWDICIFKIDEHKNWIKSVAILPDDSYFASASLDLTVRFWDLVTGTCFHQFRVPKPAYSAAFSPNEPWRIALGLEDSTVLLRDIASEAQLVLKGHTGSVTAIAFSPNGETIVSGSEDKTARIWSTVKGALLRTIQGHSGWINSVVYSPDGSKIITGSDDKLIRIWNAATGVSLLALASSLGVTSIAYSPTAPQIASGSYDGIIRIWSIKGPCLTTFKGHSGVYSVAYSPDGSRIISGHEDHSIRVWDISTGDRLVTLSGDAPVRSVAYSHNGSRIISGSDNIIQIWDARASSDSREGPKHLFSFDSDSPPSDHTDNPQHTILQLAVSPSRVAFCNHHDLKTVLLRDVHGASISVTEKHDVSHLKFSPNGTHLAVASFRTIQFYSRFDDTHPSRQSLNGNWKKVTASAFSQDGIYFAFADIDHRIRLCVYNLNSAYRENDGTLQLQRGNISADIVGLRFSLDGSYIVAVDNEMYHIYSVATRAQIMSGTQSSHAPGVVFSSDQRSINFFCHRFREEWSVNLRQELWPRELKPSLRLDVHIEDGWLYAEAPRRRFCWIPLRPRNALYVPNRIQNEDRTLLIGNLEKGNILWISWYHADF